MTDLDERRAQALATIDRRQARGRVARRLLVPSAIAGFLLVVGGGFLANYQPLVGASNWSTKDECTQQVGVFTPWNGEEFQVTEMTCDQNGDVVTWGFSVLNAGRIPITVLGFDTTLPSILARATLSTASDDNIRALEPFAPFRLSRGERRWVWYRSRIVACGPDEAGSTAHSLGVRMRYKIGPVTRSDVFTGQQVIFGCAPPEGLR